MKSLLLFAFGMMILVMSTSAQGLSNLKPDRVIVTSTDTTSNADTTSVSFIGIGGKVKGFQASVIKVSGTVAGKVYLQGNINGDWVSIDSLTATDQALSTKLFPISSTTCYSYRAYYITTGTQKSYIRFAYLRRQDE